MCKESKTKVTLETVKSVITHVQNLYPKREIMSQESVRTKLTRLILRAERLILKHKKDKMDNISWISGEQEKLKLKLFDVWKPKTKLVDPSPPSPKRIKIKHELIDKLPALPLTENDNILNEEVHIKDEPIDQKYLLPSRENTNFTNSSICQKIKQEISETCDKLKLFNDPEKSEVSGIFVKSETDIKPEIIFGISDSDSKHDMSAVNNDPLHISVYEGKEVSQQQNGCSICPCFWLLGVESRDFSQAEKQTTVFKADQIHKMKAIFTQSDNLGPF